MSVLQSIQSALSGAGIALGAGKYPQAGGVCGKVVFAEPKKPVRFLGGEDVCVETFKVVVCGDDYHLLEEKLLLIKAALKDAGFIQTGGYEDVDSDTEEPLLQLAVSFKCVRK